MDELTLYTRKERENLAKATVGLRGIWAAKIWIVLPALFALPMIWLFGEEDYIAPIVYALWIWCLRLGLRFYRTGSVGSVRKSMGLHTIIWSAFFAVMTFVWTLAILVDGNWRWVAPSWW